MKYAEYLEPELVTSLMRLHTQLKDLEGHVRQYARGEWFPQDSGYYDAIAAKGAAVSAMEIVRSVNHLKSMGYSEPAALETVPDDSGV